MATHKCRTKRTVALLIAIVFCSTRSSENEDGERHLGRSEPSFCCQASLRFPDRRETVSHSRLPSRRRSFHSTFQGGEILFFQVPLKDWIFGLSSLFALIFCSLHKFPVSHGLGWRRANFLHQIGRITLKNKIV